MRPFAIDLKIVEPGFVRETNIVNVTMANAKAAPVPEAYKDYSNSTVQAFMGHVQLSSRRFIIEVDGDQHRLDPDALLLVGTADFLLRQPRNDVLIDSVSVHDADEGGRFDCHNAGLVEAVTQSIPKHLSAESCEDRDAFVSAAIKIDSIYLTARLDITVRMLARSTDTDLAAWARQVLAGRVGPAFLRPCGRPLVAAKAA
ncbi:hypothetical protein DBIPINDM_007522 (plasmid) [Mesorhizobium sp. AR02]|uniref:hypothetical protein n=1 Tax=Mesorhizobium sp. AR02 TaxID=2865837 RepID=UPI00215EDCBD|nr:hypothetical protein [Mesorhizobium sp. AR02]UVK50215.1 hypothetical protein DBIPINDM_007522 [Mesorhizobium sp. AR02]